MSSDETNDPDFGPLAQLIGSWRGDKGEDVSPDDPDEKREPYYETLTFMPIGDVTNAKQQKLMAVHYQQSVYRRSDDCMFHNETGYWSWDAANNIVMHSLTIPRGLALLAGGTWERDADGTTHLHVEAAMDDPDWSISQSSFMRDNATTTGFIHDITVSDDTLRYEETTVVNIYGREYQHTDSNTLERDPD